MVTKKVAPRKPKTDPVLTGQALLNAAEQYLKVKAQREFIQKQEDKLKGQLKASIENHFEEDVDGHQYLEFDAPVEGFKALKRECRTSTSLNEPKAEGWLKGKGLWLPVDKGGVVEVVEVIDQDALLRLTFDGKIKEKELDALFTVSKTYALVSVKA